MFLVDIKIDFRNCLSISCRKYLIHGKNFNLKLIHRDVQRYLLEVVKELLYHIEILKLNNPDSNFFCENNKIDMLPVLGGQRLYPSNNIPFRLQ